MTDTPTEQPLTLLLDTTALQRNLSRAAEAMGDRLLPSLRAITQQLARALEQPLIPNYFHANTVVHVAGLCARYQVRAGLDPLYTSHGNIDLLVQAILDGDDPEAEGLQLLTLGNRVLVAVSAMRGWSESHGWAVPQGVMHRQWGDTQVQVRCG